MLEMQTAERYFLPFPDILLRSSLMFLRSFLSYFTKSRTPIRKRRNAGSNRYRLLLEHLEDRTVPTVLDLTGATSEGVINDAIFRRLDSTNSTGSGVIM